MTSSPVALLCCVAIPALVVLAYTYWAKITRRDLPHWRNALGLISILVISVDWLFQTAVWVFYALNVAAPIPSTTAWAATHLEIYYLAFAIPSSFLLKGVPRIFLIAAWLLMSVYNAHFFIA
jgi:hypothetical protein